MSSSKFDEKRRVAHSGICTNEALQKQLEFKKQMMAKLASKINGGSPPKPTFGVSKARNGVIKAPAPKKARHDEEGDDWLDDEEEEEMLSESEDEEDMGLSDDEGMKRKKKHKAAAKSVVAARITAKEVEKKEDMVTKNGAIAPAKKERTLSDDSDEEDGNWLEKPRLGGPHPLVGARMQTKKKEEKKPRRKIVISSSEDEEEEEKEQVQRDESNSRSVTPKAVSVPKAQIEGELKLGTLGGTPTVTVKQVKSKKRSKAASESEGENSGSDDARAESDSEASDEEAVSAATLTLRQTTLDFFNKASRESLLTAPRIVDRLADHILSKRPFTTFLALQQSFSVIPRAGGKAIMEAYMEYLENRGVLEQILDDCKEHFTKMAEKTTLEHVDLPLLAEGHHLHAYQQAGVDWLVEMHAKGLNAILADEMGLGKTIQVIAFFSWLKKEQVRGPHLVVVPSSTVENWMTEIKKWCPSLKIITYYGNQDERKDIRHAAKKRKDTVDVVLTTYNMIGSKSDDKKFFKHFSINYVVFDEGHMLKNCSTDRYKNLLKIKTQRKILLTGTPLQNNLIELISLMYFTIPKVFNRYCEDVAQLLSHFKQQRPALEGSDELLYQRDRIEQAKAILQPYILRRVKAQVLVDLPPKTEETVEVVMVEEQEEIYGDVLDGLRKLENGEASNAYGGLMRLRQAANHPLLRRKHYDDRAVLKIAKQLCLKEKPYVKKKAEYVAEELEGYSDFALHQLCEKYISCHKFLLEGSLALQSGKLQYLDKKLAEIKEKGDKVLIFSQFTSMLDILQVYLQLREYSFSRLDGSTPVLERLDMINKYNEDPEQFVFLLSTRAGGLGINLVSANHIILHDIDFNPYNDKQAEDRCHRMGQQKPVFVTRLISKDTIEVDMNRLARKKLQLEKDVTKGSRGLEEETGVSSDEAKQILTDLIARSPAKNVSTNETPSKKGRNTKSSSRTPQKRRNSRDS